MTRAFFYSIVFLTIFKTQSQNLESLIVNNSFAMKIEAGKLVGSDMEKFKNLLVETQFVSIAEEHEVREVNSFSTALFDLLSNQYNYNYLALEQGPILCNELNKRKIENVSNSVKSYALNYKRAFHFSSDQELEFLEVSARMSSATNPFWGCNQEYGAEHVLNLLHELADSQYKSRIKALINHAHEIEQNRKDNYPYMCCVKKPEDFFQIDNFKYSKDSVYAQKLVNSLLTSQFIYDLNNKSNQNNPTIYENSFIREEYMKRQFYENYRKAKSQSDELPKVMLKFGHWHLKNGLGPSGIPTLGNFVSNIAFTNQKTNLTIGVFLNNDYDEFRGYKKGSLREFMCSMIPKSNTYTLISTIPLRKYYYGVEIKNQVPEALRDKFHDLIYSYDMLLYISNATSVTWNLVYGSD